MKIKKVDLINKVFGETFVSNRMKIGQVTMKSKGGYEKWHQSRIGFIH